MVHLCFGVVRPFTCCQPSINRKVTLEFFDTVVFVCSGVHKIEIPTRLVAAVVMANNHPTSIVTSLVGRDLKKIAVSSFKVVVGGTSCSVLREVGHM